MVHVTNTQLYMDDVLAVDPQARSVWLYDGTRLGYAACRKRGLDPQDVEARHPEKVYAKNNVVENPSASTAARVAQTEHVAVNRLGAWS